MRKATMLESRSAVDRRWPQPSLRSLRGIIRPCLSRLLSRLWVANWISSFRRDEKAWRKWEWRAVQLTSLCYLVNESTRALGSCVLVKGELFHSQPRTMNGKLRSIAASSTQLRKVKRAAEDLRWADKQMIFFPYFLSTSRLQFGARENQIEVGKLS